MFLATTGTQAEDHCQGRLPWSDIFDGAKPQGGELTARVNRIALNEQPTWVTADGFSSIGPSKQFYTSKYLATQRNSE